jgi:hypothetical protein
MPRLGRLTPGKTRYPYYTGGWWSSVTVWAGAEYLSRTGIRPPDRPARSESLYRLNYPGPLYISTLITFVFYPYLQNHLKTIFHLLCVLRLTFIGSKLLSFISVINVRN